MTRFRPLRTLLTAISLTVASGWVSTATANDWPQWRGPDRNAISQEKGLLQEWPADGPPLAWKSQGLGGGDSAPAVAGGKLFGMANRGNREVVWALSEANGKEVWVTTLGDAVQQGMPQSREGPSCTPTVDGTRLYVIGMGGRLACMNVADGKIIWQKSLTEDFGGAVPNWSYRESPLVDGDKLICTPGGADALLVALDKANGETIWKSQLPASAAGPPTPDRGGRPGGPPGRSGPGRGGRGGGGRAGAAYSSVIAIDFEGQRQYVQLTASALVGVAASDGKFLWRYDRPANNTGINCSTPIFQDGLVFAASAYGAGGGAVKLVKDGSGNVQAEQVYFTPNMQNHHGGMIVLDGALYGANGGNGGGFMSCLDFQTGEILWRDRNAPKGSLAWADGRLYLRSEEGPIVLIEPSRAGFVPRGRFEQPDRSRAPAWAHPVVANGKLYIRDQDVLLSYDIKAR